jgi:cell division protein FtsB
VLRWTVVVVALVFYVLQFVAGDKGVVRRLQIERELEMMQVENTRLAIQKDRLLNEVQLKENDPLSLERLAREKYWMVAPGEQVYRFNEDDVVPEEAGEVKPWMREDPDIWPEDSVGAGERPSGAAGSGPASTK